MSVPSVESQEALDGAASIIKRIHSQDIGEIASFSQM